MSVLKDLFRLLRVEQWYKNAVVFIPLIFSFNLFNLSLLLLTLAGFVALCLTSSSYYIINDLHDIEKDKNHPEKKNRPIASGRISKSLAILVSILSICLGVFIAAILSVKFLAFVVLLFLVAMLYTFHLRNVAFADILTISVNFVIRTVSGIFIVKVPISYWVILCIFFMAMFLVSMKRSSEINLSQIGRYRPNFSKADKEVLNFLATISIACVFIFFSVYSILFERPALLLSIPPALYIAILFFHNLYASPEKVRNPEKFIFDKKTLPVFLLWLIILVTTFYLFR